MIAYVLQPNEAKVGTTFLIMGIATASGANAPTYRVRVGPTSLTGNIAGSLTGVLRNGDLCLTAILTFITVGSGGTCKASLSNVAPSAAIPEVANSAATATVAVDTTITNLIEFTTQCASTNNYNYRNLFITKVVN